MKMKCADRSYLQRAIRRPRDYTRRGAQANDSAYFYAACERFIKTANADTAMLNEKTDKCPYVQAQTQTKRVITTSKSAPIVFFEARLRGCRLIDGEHGSVRHRRTRGQPASGRLAVKRKTRILDLACSAHSVFVVCLFVCSLLGANTSMYQSYLQPRPHQKQLFPLQTCPLCVSAVRAFLPSFLSSFYPTRRDSTAPRYMT